MGVLAGVECYIMLCRFQCAKRNGNKCREKETYEKKRKETQRWRETDVREEVEEGELVFRKEF